MTTLSKPLARAAALATAAALIASLAACTGTPAADTSTVTIAYDSDLAPQGYDPLRYSTGQAIMFSGLYDSLAVRQEDGSVAPGLATEFAYNEDNSVLTLTIAEGVEFTDGSTLSADLVKANLDRRSDPELVAYSAFATGGATEITSVDVVDPTHVALTFLAPQAGFETNLAGVTGMIVGQTAVDDPASLGTTPDGSGPFALADSTVKGSSYVLEKKDAHPDLDKYGFDTVIFKPIEDPQARTNAIISGQADTGDIDTTTASLASDKGLELSQIGGTIFSFLVFDHSGVTNPAFADPNVRIALGLAIDRNEFVDGVHPGNIPAVNALPKGSPGFSDDLDAEFAYDPEKAKQLLADAGYPDLTFDVVTLGDTTDLEAIQAYFAEVGVTMNVLPASSTEELFAAVNTSPVGPIALGWGNPVGVMFGVILGFADPHKDAPASLGGLTGAVAGAQTDEDRAAALGALNDELIRTGSYIPVYEQLTSWASNGDKVAPIVFPGGDSTPLLSSIKPAE
jgi:peptide/nickel transport system substrate-binding protein